MRHRPPTVDRPPPIAHRTVLNLKWRKKKRTVGNGTSAHIQCSTRTVLTVHGPCLGRKIWRCTGPRPLCTLTPPSHTRILYHHQIPEALHAPRPQPGCLLTPRPHTHTGVGRTPRALGVRTRVALVVRDSRLATGDWRLATRGTDLVRISILRYSTVRRDAMLTGAHVLCRCLLACSSATSFCRRRRLCVYAHSHSHEKETWHRLARCGRA